MNGLDTLLAQLPCMGAQHAAGARREGGRGQGVTERLRAVLRTGSKTSAELAAATGLEQITLVSALLKHDRKRGRVSFDGSTWTWTGDAI